MKDFLCYPVLANGDPAPPCAVGDVIGDRFRIIRQVGQGGMGIVYEAFDQKRRQRIAIKFPRAGFGRLLSPELEAALKVRHPNVCLVNEIHSVKTADGEADFLTMEFLDGESLASYLERNQTVSEEDAISLALQLCAGLDAAHRSGVIHRDLKAANVILCRSSETNALRAVITDFGLAGEATKSGFFGTQRYLAPELLLGSPATYSTDIYALGVILFEITTGVKPDRGPKTLPLFNVPKSYKKVMAGFLSLDPEVRARTFKTAPALLASKQISRRQLTGLALALSSGAAGAFWFGRDAITEWFEPLPRKRFVALLAWPIEQENLSRSLVAGAIDGIENELARAESTDPNLFVTSVRNFGQAGVPIDASLQKLAASLGVNLALQISGFHQGGNFGLLFNLRDAVSGQLLRRHHILCSESEIAALTLMAVREAASLLHVDWQPHAASRLRPATSSAAALQAFQSGRELRNQANDSGLLAAIEAYKKALELAGNYAAAYTELAVSYHHLHWNDPRPGLLPLAMANVRKAIQLDATSPDAHLELAMLLAEQGDSKSAEAELATAVRLDPGNPRLLVRQGELYENAGEWSLAERTYRALQRERPNYWLGYNNCGNVLLLTGRYTEARDLFQIASVASPGSVLALTNLGEVNFRLGKLRDAEEIYRRSLSIKGTDLTLKLLGDLLRVKGDYANALVCEKSAVAQVPSNDVNWLSLADCYEAMGGHQREAKEAFERAMAEVTSDNPLNCAPILRLALYIVKIGSKNEAQALVRKPELNRQLDLDSELLRTRVLELSGRRTEALQTIAACLRRGPVRFQLEAMKDLADLRRDPGYGRLFGRTN